jgi:ATPase family associated with various cellular activities (AAA)
MQHKFRHSPFRWDEAGLTVDLPGGVSLRADSSALVESLLGLRAFQAFDSSAAHFPIHRELRFSSRRAIDVLFDDLATHVAPRAHRLEVGSIVMEGEGFVASIAGRRKMDYTSGIARVWAADIDRVREIQALISSVVADSRVREEMFTIDWYFAASHGLSNVAFEELADPELVDTAYPTVEGGVAAFVARYIESGETVLVVQGPPGTGKTRLVRAILAALSRRKGDIAMVLYTADRRALDDGEIYVDFLTGEHDAFVVEDADYLLGARTNGNVELHRFLTVADGVVRAQGRKIIFTTNLPNIGDIDEALVRPGRCFQVLRTRALMATEAERLLNEIPIPDGFEKGAVLAHLFDNGVSAVTLAEFYRAVERHRQPTT